MAFSVEDHFVYDLVDDDDDDAGIGSVNKTSNDQSFEEEVVVVEEGGEEDDVIVVDDDEDREKDFHQTSDFLQQQPPAVTPKQQTPIDAIVLCNHPEEHQDHDSIIARGSGGGDGAPTAAAAAAHHATNHGPAKKQRQSSEFSCSICTFKNRWEVKSCEMCGNPSNGKQRQQQQQQQLDDDRKRPAVFGDATIHKTPGRQKLSTWDPSHNQTAQMKESTAVGADADPCMSLGSSASSLPIIAAAPPSKMPEKNYPPETVEILSDDGEDYYNHTTNTARRRRRSKNQIKSFHKRTKTTAITASTDALSSCDDDFLLAQRLQAEEDQKQSPRQPQEQLRSDFALAERFQKEEVRFRRKELRRARKQQEKLMLSSSEGKSWKLVEEIVHLSLQQQENNVKMLAHDDIVFLANRMFVQQQEFRRDMKDTTVTVAYHYTHDANLEKIRQNGLMTIAERRQEYGNHPMGLIAGGAAYFGDGIYTANNPAAFLGFGQIGLLVAILKGNVKGRVGPKGLDKASPDINTVIGNKMIPQGTGGDNCNQSHYHDEIVLRSASQVVPLLTYPKTLVQCTNGMHIARSGLNAHKLLECHRKVQAILDRFFNNGQHTHVEYPAGHPKHPPAPMNTPSRVSTGTRSTKRKRKA